jgi:hypothetical protein
MNTEKKSLLTFFPLSYETFAFECITPNSNVSFLLKT